MIVVRIARDDDAPVINRIFEASYGHEYTYPDYYDEQAIRKLIFSDDTLMLVAENTETGKVLGTASVVLERGAHTDLVGEFGRLAVFPEARGQGVGGKLLRERLERVKDRLHVGYMEARVEHPFSVRNGLRYGFSPVGFLPMKLKFGERRESTCYMVRFFGEAIDLRRNHPRIVPEAYAIADLAMRQMDLEPDMVVDESASSYPYDDDFETKELTEKGYSSLLRIERGRLRKREIFGPLRLHYGFFKLRSQDSGYVIALRDGQIHGGIGFTTDHYEGSARIFELICVDENAIRFLLDELEKRCREWGLTCIEVDVNADAPRMQRTLIELGYLPAAYVPALAFHRVERLDVVKMLRLLVPLDVGEFEMEAAAADLAETVLHAFRRREVLSGVGEMAARAALFRGLNQEQVGRLAAACEPVTFDSGEDIFRQHEDCAEAYLVLEGEVVVRLEGRDRPVGVVGPGECIGEVALLGETPHSATGSATSPVRAVRLGRASLNELVRTRPDIGVVLYRNLAEGLGDKLRRADRGQLDGSAGAE